jgi:hypothetical protein
MKPRLREPRAHALDPAPPHDIKALCLQPDSHNQQETS